MSLIDDQDASSLANLLPFRGLLIVEDRPLGIRRQLCALDNLDLFVWVNRQNLPLPLVTDGLGQTRITSFRS